MKKNTLILTLLIFNSIFLSNKVIAQEFPIAIENDSTFAGGVAFDGTNYLITIVGDVLSKDNITFQFISPSGILVGNRISLGQKGGNAQVAFDGTNYLLVWNGYNWNPFTQEPYDTTSVFGQFITPSGIMAGSRFTIQTGIDNKHLGSVSFHDTTYLLTYLKGGNHINYLYGQLISKTGILIGAAIQISNNYAREVAKAFDGTNYLVAWVEGSGFPNDKVVYGQFLSNTGLLVNSNFIIDVGVGLSDNPMAMAFDGSRYLIAFHEQAMDNNSRWNLYARFVSTAGIVDPTRVTICDSTQNPFLPSVAFNGTNYLITWVNMFSEGTLNSTQIKGRIFNTSGLPIDTAFEIFNVVDNKFPIGGVGLFENNQFLIVGNRIDTNFTNGDVYGVFLDAFNAEILEKKHFLNPINIYPNPSSENISVNYPNPGKKDLEIRIFNSKGELVRFEILKFDDKNINIENLPNGNYLLTIKTEDIIVKQKIIVGR
jgi:hypothetical protein